MKAKLQIGSGSLSWATWSRIKSLEDIGLYFLPVKEFDVIVFSPGATLKDEVLKISLVQMQA